MPERGGYNVEFATTFAEVARSLLDERGVEATLDRICRSPRSSTRLG